MNLTTDRSTDLSTWTALAELSGRIRDTGAQIAVLEASIARFPEERGLAVSLRSLVKRMANLERQFAELTQT